MEGTDFIGAEEHPLLWLKAEVTSEILKLSFLLSNSSLNRVIPGFELYIANPGISESFREVQELSGEIKSLSEAQEELLSFLSSHTAKGTCKLAGVNCHLERHILMSHFTEVHNHLFYRIVELNTIFHVLGLSSNQQTTPLEDFRILKEVRLGYFKGI